MRALLAALLLGMAVSAACASAALAAPAEAGLCGGAIQTAQERHAVPQGLLFAIGEVESGRWDAVAHRVTQWPWTVQAQGQSYYFQGKAEAVAWVQAAQARGVVSIDVGCMQINLMYHPAAFQNLDDAFEPGPNADYAARFLVSLHAATNDWQQAAGLYHSQTLALAIPYAQRVEEALTGKRPSIMPPAAPKPTMLTMLQAAWGATMDNPPAAPPVPTPLVSWSVLATPPALLAPFRRRHIRRSPGRLRYEH